MHRSKTLTLKISGLDLIHPGGHGSGARPLRSNTGYIDAQQQADALCQMDRVIGLSLTAASLIGRAILARVTPFVRARFPRQPFERGAISPFPVHTL